MTPQQTALWPTAPTSRPSDPATSAAAVPSQAHLSDLHAHILAEHKRWAEGLTDDELCVLLASVHMATLVKRCSELRNGGLIVDSGKTRPTRTGRQAIVWRLAP